MRPILKTLRILLLLTIWPLVLDVQAEGDAQTLPTPAPASAVTVEPVVAAPAEAVPMPVAEAPPAPAPEPENCRSLTMKAMAADMKAFTAQSQKEDLSEQAKLFDVSISSWYRAVELCEGHAKEQAQTNLSDSRRVRAAIAEQLGAGQQCLDTHKDAEAFQLMARQALSERRWEAAAMLFYKSEGMWELAAEQCTGSQREAAMRHRGEARIDGHNAKYCAPLFERAREEAKKLRSSDSILAPDEKKGVSMMAETLWREAIVQCQGSSVQDIARSNAQSLGKERGTPFVAVPLPLATTVAPSPVTPVKVAAGAVVPATPANMGGSVAPATVTKTPAAQEAPPPEPEAPVAKVSVQALATPPALSVAPLESSATEKAGPSVKASPEVTAPPVVHEPTVEAAPARPRVVEFKAEKAIGLDAYTGVGKIVWISGSVYEGELVKGVRHGRGAMLWESGQSYDGEWANGKPEGGGVMKFANGDRYQGAIQNAVPQGKGRMQYVSGDVYEGDFTAGKPDGKGNYVWQSGQQFDGGWKIGRPHGQGRMKYANGAVYAGDYVDGEREGQGEFICPDGDKYIGQWKAGKKSGQGAYIWKNGSRWEGRFDNDERTEEGKLTMAE